MLYAGPSLETWNLLIIIHNSLGVSEYGSCITAQQLCVGHSPPLKYDNRLKSVKFCLIVWCDNNANVLEHNWAKVGTVYSKMGGRGEPRNLAKFAAENCGPYWLTLPRRVLSTYWCCPFRPCVVFLACVHLASFVPCIISFFRQLPCFLMVWFIVC